MRLSQRITRALADGELDDVAPTPSTPAPTPSTPARSPDSPGSTDLVGRLRREIARMERTHAVVAREPLGVSIPRATSSVTAHEEMRRVPRPVDAPLLYQHDYGVDDRHGKAPLRPPDGAMVARIGDLLALQGTGAAVPGAEASPPPVASCSLSASELLFIDTETTGLSRGAGTIAFIIGVGGFWGKDGALRVDQIVLHDPARESEGLTLLASYLARAKVLVSFNGRTFDIPVLRNRGLLNRMPLLLRQPHLDLLPWCRRHFRSRLSDCRLATLEAQLLGFQRCDDLPGSEAPRVYEEYLRGGSFCQMERLLEHNRHDVAALPALMLRLARHVFDPLSWAEDAEELLATGLFQLTHGAASLGEACLRRAIELSRWPETRQRALDRLARHLRRQGRKDEAARCWEQYREEFPRCNVGWIELAKHHEHTTRDLERALTLAEAAPGRDAVDLAHRRERLQRRIANRQSPTA